jgi:hypothetical protein
VIATGRGQTPRGWRHIYDGTAIELFAKFETEVYQAL